MKSLHFFACGFVILAIVTSLNAAEPRRETDKEASILFAQERGLRIYERDRAAFLTPIPHLRHYAETNGPPIGETGYNSLILVTWFQG